MPLKRCRECGRSYNPETGEIEKRVAVTERGLQYHVWVCAPCWENMGGNIKFHDDKEDD